MDSIKILLESCPKLRMIGPLNCWKNLSAMEIKGFEQDIKRFNWDLNIRPDRSI